MTVEILDSGVDEDTLDVLDFEHEAPCDYNRYRAEIDGSEPCEQVAAWRIRLTCCGRVHLMCEDHFNRLLDLMSTGGLLVDKEEDGGCGSSMFNPFSSAERIK